MVSLLLSFICSTWCYIIYFYCSLSAYWQDNSNAISRCLVAHYVVIYLYCNLSAHWQDNSNTILHCSIVHYIYITAYTATRSVTHGSWFIRVLVATFYKHSHDKHLEKLFRIVSCNFYILSWYHCSWDSVVKEGRGGWCVHANTNLLNNNFIYCWLQAIKLWC